MKRKDSSADIGQLTHLLKEESEKFQEYYLWLENNMSPIFFKGIGQANVMLIVHNIMEFESQSYYSAIQLKNMAIVMCLDEPNIDLKILKNFSDHGISSYQTYLSKAPPPFLTTPLNIRIVVVHFRTESIEVKKPPYPAIDRKKLRNEVEKINPEITDEQFEIALHGICEPFFISLPIDSLATAIAMFCRAMTRDHCQYEVKYNEDWEAKGLPSMQIILAWRNTPRHHFLYRLIRTVQRNNLVVKNISASYQNLYQTNSILVMAIELHGNNNKPVWEVANILNFLKDFITVKYFASFDGIDKHLVQTGIITGSMANLLRAMGNFIHQALVHLDVNLYTLEHIEEGLYRHPELTAQLCSAFEYRFNPEENDETKYSQVRDQYLLNVSKLDTGHEENDIRRKNILRQAMNFVHFTLKTNFYRPNYTALSFRLDPSYLDEIPFDRSKKFPDLPYAIIFVKGMHFFGFHIRFRDLARGGLRTVYPDHIERMILERNTVFTECYGLAYTQQMKNKDIPEGGAKAIIFLKPYERLESEAEIYRNELQIADVPANEIEQLVGKFCAEQKTEHLYQAQRSFIENLMTLVNCNPDGTLRTKDIIDYWRKPEYIYLGPDENMHDSMIQWIAAYSKKQGYKPGSSFISGKPYLGINHKEYGVTSLGLNVYMEVILKYININPFTDSFTVKMSGGPDGDVAGNQICNLQRYYPGTAKLVALTDVSGTIFDPKGLDLNILVNLFHQSQSIRFYPPEALNEGGFIVDKFTKQYETPLVQQTLCWKKQDGKLIQAWLSGSDMNFLLRHNVHQTKADVFIPAGGRPRTLNESNYMEFLDATGTPSSQAIIEGANLYLNSKARRSLEDLGVLIIKDSSANKTGVICSSFEVLSGLALGDELFVANKQQLVKEILDRLRACANNEANLLIRTHRETGEPLTEISDRISKRINQFTDQLLEYLDEVSLPEDPNDPLIACFLDYCLPLLRDKYQQQLLNEIPDLHKKAIIACHLAASLVYDKGLDWFPSVVDILPMLLIPQRRSYSAL